MPPRLALIFDFDGTLYVGDLPILAYARHCAEQLTEPAATELIDGIRFFLEGKAVGAALVDLGPAEDGYQAVEILAAAAGLTDDQVAIAYRQARADLAESAFALDPPDDLPELLQELSDVHVQVVTNADAAGVSQVLSAIGLAGFIDQVTTDAGKPAGMATLIAATLRHIDAMTEPGRLLVVGDRWPADLADAGSAGAITAMVDRFGRGDGNPTMRAATTAGLVPGIRAWARRWGGAGAGGVGAGGVGASTAGGLNPATLRTPDDLPAEVPELVLFHLSDTHLTSRGVPYNGVIDPAAALRRVVAVIEDANAQGRGPDAIVVSGDLTDSGDPDAYRRLHRALRPLTPQLIYATGNHDVRTVMHAELLGEPDRTEPLLQVHRPPACRILVLDSTVVGGGHGVLTPAHLAELAAELAVPHPGGTVLVMHHPPLPAPSTLLTYFALDRASRAALASVIGGTDVRLILAGHHHLAGSGMLAGVPVAVAPSTAIRTDPLIGAGQERTVGSAGFNLVQLYPDTITVSVIPVDQAPQIFRLDPDGCAAVIAAHPISRPAPGQTGVA